MGGDIPGMRLVHPEESISLLKQVRMPEHQWIGRPKSWVYVRHGVVESIRTAPGEPLVTCSFCSASEPRFRGKQLASHRHEFFARVCFS